MDQQTKDDEQPNDALRPEAQKEWLTPELIIEDINDLTQGGTGGQPVFGGENKVTTFYHS
jgi:hypothetical protein